MLKSIYFVIGSTDRYVYYYKTKTAVFPFHPSLSPLRCFFMTALNMASVNWKGKSKQPL